MIVYILIFQTLLQQVILKNDDSSDDETRLIIIPGSEDVSIFSGSQQLFGPPNYTNKINDIQLKLDVPLNKYEKMQDKSTSLPSETSTSTLSLSSSSPESDSDSESEFESESAPLSSSIKISTTDLQDNATNIFSDKVFRIAINSNNERTPTIKVIDKSQNGKLKQSLKDYNKKLFKNPQKKLEISRKANKLFSKKHSYKFNIYPLPSNYLSKQIVKNITSYTKMLNDSDFKLMEKNINQKLTKMNASKPYQFNILQDKFHYKFANSKNTPLDKLIMNISLDNKNKSSNNCSSSFIPNKLCIPGIKADIASKEIVHKSPIDCINFLKKCSLKENITSFYDFSSHLPSTSPLSLLSPLPTQSVSPIPPLLSLSSPCLPTFTSSSPSEIKCSHITKNLPKLRNVNIKCIPCANACKSCKCKQACFLNSFLTASENLQKLFNFNKKVKKKFIQKYKYDKAKLFNDINCNYNIKVKPLRFKKNRNKMPVKCGKQFSYETTKRPSSKLVYKGKSIVSKERYSKDNYKPSKINLDINKYNNNGINWMMDKFANNLPTYPQITYPFNIRPFFTDDNQISQLPIKPINNLDYIAKGQNLYSQLNEYPNSKIENLISDNYIHIYNKSTERDYKIPVRPIVFDEKIANLYPYGNYFNNLQFNQDTANYNKLNLTSNSNSDKLSENLPVQTVLRPNNPDILVPSIYHATPIKGLYVYDRKSSKTYWVPNLLAAKMISTP